MPPEPAEEEDKQESMDIEDGNNTDEGAEGNAGPESGAKSSVKSKTLGNPAVVTPSDAAPDVKDGGDQSNKAEENKDAEKVTADS